MYVIGPITFALIRPSPRYSVSGRAALDPLRILVIRRSPPVPVVVFFHSLPCT